MIEHPVALIIARGGSKRLPRKNVLPFCGKPLVEWSIIQLRCSRVLTEDQIYLSTDDDEIAGIGERHGIHIIRRPDWPDADRLSACVVYKHAFETILQARPVSHAYTLLPTQVIRHPWDFWNLTQRYYELEAAGYDCGEVLLLAEQRETVIHKQRGVLARPVAFDKGFHYFGQGPSVEIHKLEHLQRVHALAIRYDSEWNTTPQGRAFTYRWVYWLEGRWYQTYDIDDQDSFELCEILFERYVLKGRGDAVYWEYKRGGDGDGRVDEGERAAAGRGSGG